MQESLFSDDDPIDRVARGQVEYYQKAYSLALMWIRGRKAFASEDFQGYAEQFLGESKEKRIFGAVFRELKKNQLISHIGFRTSKKEHCHGAVVRMWKSNLL